MRLVDQLRTTTFAFTLRYMVLFFVSVTILMAVINWSVGEFLESRADRGVLVTTDTLSLIYRQGGVDSLRPYMQARQAAEREIEGFYLLADAAYRPLAGNLDAWPELTPGGDGWVSFRLAGATDSMAARGRVTALPGGAWLLVGRRVQAFGALTEILDRAFVTILGLTLLLAFAGGLLMSNDVLRRVNAINRTSRQIMSGDLSRRMPTRGTNDEFDELSLNLNEMLDQIESLIGSIRHMSDNVAHDLRTPLSRLRGRLENLRMDARPRDLDEIDACLRDADGLLATFNALLSITRLESGAADAQFDQVDLAQIAHDACELYQAVAEERDIELACDAEQRVPVNGDRNLIFQALTNLLDNAIKYGKPGGHIKVRADADEDGSHLTVSDDGPGIPEDRREQVLQRFYRLDDSRSAPGAGLGLSLVQAIAQRHKAAFRLENNDPGLCARLSFATAG